MRRHFGIHLSLPPSESTRCHRHCYGTAVAVRKWGDRVTGGVGEESGEKDAR